MLLLLIAPIFLVPLFALLCYFPARYFALRWKWFPALAAFVFSLLSCVLTVAAYILLNLEVLKQQDAAMIPVLLAPGILLLQWIVAGSVYAARIESKLPPKNAPDENDPVAKFLRGTTPGPKWMSFLTVSTQGTYVIGMITGSIFLMFVVLNWRGIVAEVNFQAHDAAYCKTVEYTRKKSCYEHAAQRFSDPALCEAAGNDRYMCFDAFAGAAPDMEACNKLDAYLEKKQLSNNDTEISNSRLSWVLRCRHQFTKGVSPGYGAPVNSTP